MFGKKGRRPVAIQTLIGADAHLDGDLVFSGGCHIDGVINGSVSGGADKNAYLSISQNGRVEGNVCVPCLGLSGSVEGDVVVTEKAELSPTARVNGNVHYNLIEIAAGAEINGQLIHESSPAQASTSAADDAAEALPYAELQSS
jgi:cytoskeletal protein CcmA (bactofilin family)